MEDDDEIDSPSPSPSPPPPPSHPNGRLTVTSQPVTVATAPPHQTLTLALPIQQPRIGGPVSGAGSANVHHGREDCWSEGATSTLIDAWGERYLELSRGNLKQKHWKDVSDAVSSREDYTKTPKTDIQCKNRIDTLKKKYKLEKSKIASGGGPSKWAFFDTVDRLIGANIKNNNNSADHHPPPLQQPPPLKIRRSLDRTRPGTGAAAADSESSPGTDSTDSLPPEVGKGRKRVRRPIEDLTRAILRFGEVYERIERSKLDRAVEMEKQRMGFVKEVELQRMQFYMKTQLELTQLKHGGRFGNNSNHKG